jgi:hypothetical protein
MALQSVCWTLPLFSFLIFYIVGRTLWAGDQPVARQLPTHITTQAQNNIHALSVIRTHDPSVRASEDSSCLRPRGHCDVRSTFNTSFKLQFCVGLVTVRRDGRPRNWDLIPGRSKRFFFYA